MSNATGTTASATPTTATTQIGLMVAPSQTPHDSAMSLGDDAQLTVTGVTQAQHLNHGTHQTTTDQSGVASWTFVLGCLTCSKED